MTKFNIGDNVRVVRLNDEETAADPIGYESEIVEFLGTDSPWPYVLSSGVGYDADELESINV